MGERVGKKPSVLCLRLGEEFAPRRRRDRASSEANHYYCCYYRVFVRLVTELWRTVGVRERNLSSSVYYRRWLRFVSWLTWIGPLWRSLKYRYVLGTEALDTGIGVMGGGSSFLE